MKIELLTTKDKQVTYDLIFSHMSREELESFKTDNSKSYNQVIDILDRKYGICIIAKGNDNVIGYLLGEGKTGGSIPVSYAELREMRVCSSYQRMGIGSRLVERFIEWATQEGYDRLSVDVYALSDKNIEFYQKHGFTPKTLTMERWFK